MASAQFENADSCRAKWTALIRRTFYAGGVHVGRHPRTTLLLAAVVAGLLSLGLCRARLRDSVRDGYTPVDAPAHREFAAVRQFLDRRGGGQPYVGHVIVAAADGGSMLRNGTLTDVLRLNRFLIDEHAVRVDGVDYRYRNVCAPHCDRNRPLEMFAEGMMIQTERLNEGEQLNKHLSLDFPLMAFMGQNITMSGLFYGVERYNASVDPATVPSSLSSVRIVMLTFRAVKSSTLFGEILDSWELSLPEQLEKWRSASAIRPIATGERILSVEVRKVGYKVLPLFSVSFLVMLLFALSTVCLSARLRGQCGWDKVIIALVAVTSPALAILASIGGFSAIFAEMGSIVMVVPFLVLAIGVDDAFLMIHSWQSTPPSGDRAHRLGLVLSDVGPSMLITSVTNALAFGVGATSPTPEIRNFCIVTAFGMTADFAFQITFFAACLVLCDSYSGNERSQPKSKADDDDWGQRVLDALGGFVDCYSSVITSSWTAIPVVIVTGAYLFVAIKGTIEMEAYLEPQQLLLKESLVAEADQLTAKYEWNEFYLMTILVNNATELTTSDNSRVFDRIERLLHDFETLPESVGETSTNVWLRPYKHYVQQWLQNAPEEEILANFGASYENPISDSFDANDTVYYDDDSATAADLNEYPQPLLAYNRSFLLNLERWQEFIENPIYNIWNSTVIWRVSRNGTLMIDRFVVQTAFRNVRSWTKRMQLLLTCRRLAADYGDLNVTVFQRDSFLADQILGLKETALRSVLFTFVCMAVVCLVFIPDMNSTFWASVAIASITIGVVGFSHYWQIHLDGTTMAAILMSVGFSVDYTAHICYHFHNAAVQSSSHSPSMMSPEAQRLSLALRAIGWPTLQAGGSTALSVLPLLLVHSYMSEVFAKIVFLVILFGLVHGLVIVPVFLAIVPRVSKMTGANRVADSGERNEHVDNEKTLS